LETFVNTQAIRVRTAVLFALMVFSLTPQAAVVKVQVDTPAYQTATETEAKKPGQEEEDEDEEPDCS
jgi:hypothetical protein